MSYISRYEYEKMTAATRDERMAWFREARFGMFIHYGLYSALGTGEWSQANENYTVAEYEALAARFAPKKDCAREWCETAKKAGAKYAVLTTRHHEGFSLWDSKVNPYNSVSACGRDIVREFCEACREYGLKIGLYSSLMDWHREDGWRCAYDRGARESFLDYIEALNTELLTNYGKIDILWYDVACPLHGAEGWDSVARNARLRALQPHIIINNRSSLPEDFDTPEQGIHASPCDWEACMTLTRLGWGYIDEEQGLPFMISAKQILRDMHMCTCGGGNLLLNIAPAPDGSVTPDSANTLTAVSADADCKTFYLWNWVWPKNGELRFGGYMDAPVKISYLATGEEIKFTHDGHRIILRGLPTEVPDKIAGVTVLKMEFDAPPRHHFRSYYPQITGGTDFSEGNHKW